MAQATIPSAAPSVRPASPSSTRASQRDLRFDLLRGYAVLVMVVNHIGGEHSWLYPITGGNQFYVSANAKNPAIAEEFVLNVVGDPELQKALFEVGQRVPALTEAADALAGDNPELTIWSEAAAAADMMPNIPEMNAVWGPVGQATADIVKGSLSAQEAMDAAQKNIEQALGLS